ncbi:MAG: pyrrolo-quinoline quinone, partial [Anaerolineae bacterium]|nr:pyrrolo-quinoline quinone [Anaerolineae bacterium]
PVYDQYWSEYAVWVVSNDNLYFRSCDGAIVALTSGNPQASSAAQRNTQYEARNTHYPTWNTPPLIIPYTEARAWAGHTATVTGTLRYVFNNGKQVLLGFAHPHQGAFKAIIRRADWGRFDGAPEKMYHVGQPVAVTGTISWYQGDPAIYVTTPEQVEQLLLQLSPAVERHVR